MKRVVGCLLVFILLVLFSFSSLAVIVDSEVQQALQHNEEVAVIVILEEPTLAEIQTASLTQEKQQDSETQGRVTQTTSSQKLLSSQAVNNKKNEPQIDENPWNPKQEFLQETIDKKPYVEQQKQQAKFAQQQFLNDIITKEDLETWDEYLAKQKEESANRITEKITKQQKTTLVTASQEEKTQGQTKKLPSQKPKLHDFAVQKEYSTIPALSGTITRQGLQKLQQNPNVKEIRVDTILKTTLATSIPQVNADDVHNKIVSGYNITGSTKSICVIDTGIDTDHAAFTGRIKDQFCYCSITNSDDGLPCCPDNTAIDTSAEDDNGHGTATAGAALGNLNGLKGVAPQANLIAIKACRQNGDCASSDVIAAIDRCVSNSSVYNISVISLSLGDTSQNNNYCNGNSMAPSITTAVNANVSVVVSSGNQGYTAGITAPACVEDATPVGGVDSNDNIFYNRGDILQILAPSRGLTLPNRGGSTSTWSGTSFSAPHVSGAIVLLQQYYKVAYNRTPTPYELEQKIALSGVEVDDTSNSGNFYSRLDVFAAIQPFLNFTAPTPANNSIVTTATINLTSDVNISLAQLEWYYNNGTIRNFTMSRINDALFTLTITNLAEGNDYYRVLANDTADTLGYSVWRNLTVDLTNPLVNITFPDTNANSSQDLNLSTQTQEFNASILETHVDTVYFMFNNATGTAFNLTPTNNSGVWQTTINSSSLTEGTHRLTIFVNDSAGNINNTQTFSFTIDRTAPLITINSPQNNSNFSSQTTTQVFNFSIQDTTRTVDSVYLSFTNASGNSFNRTATNLSGSWNVSLNLSTLVEGKQTVTIYANDTLNNLNNSVTLTFTVDRTPPTVTFTTPSTGQNYTYFTGNVTFNATITDSNLSLDTVLFMFSNASGNPFNRTATNLSGIWQVQYNVSQLVGGSHSVTIFVNDSVNNINNTETINFTVNLNDPVVTLINPVQGFNSSNTTINFTCSALDNSQLQNVTLYGNWSGWHANQTIVFNGTSNQTTFTNTIPEGSYSWNCFVYDTSGNLGYATNQTFIVDTTLPLITSISSSPSTTTALVSWNSNELTNSTVTYGTSTSLGSITSVTTLTTSHGVSLSGLSASTLYYFNVTSCDAVGNCNTSGPNAFTTSANPTTSGGSSSGGGGGGGGSGGGGATSSTPQQEVEPDAEIGTPSSVNQNPDIFKEQKSLGREDALAEKVQPIQPSGFIAKTVTVIKSLFVGVFKKLLSWFGF